MIAATNRDLEADARAGRFREDLYFRLAVVPITVPPLSARRDDIGLLVDHFLEHHCAAHGRPPQHISAQAMIELEQREYRGNIRELSNLIERAVLLSDRNDTITAEHLFDRPAEEVPSGGPGETQSLSRTILRYERAILVEALEKHAGHRGKTAEALHITSRWLAKLLKRHKME